MPPFLIAVFLSAFLLFQIQPIIARFILPAYGGSPAVWTSCMMFFQLGLLLGYFYAHLIATRLNPRWQVILHLTLLVLSLLLMPIGVPDSWQPDVTGFPALDIFTLLALSTGIPFTLISASGPLLQHWFAGARPGKSPFRLYAVSNLGSLLALLSYPFLIEPSFTLNTQADTWSIGYGVLLPLFLICGIAYFRAPMTTHHENHDSSLPPVSTGDKLLWVTLAACGSILLLATTNQISQNIAVVPFLWVIPLSIYLLTFIICFDSDRWYQRYVMLFLTAVSLAFLIPLMLEEFTDEWNSVSYQIGTYGFALFCCCMICHGELAQSRSHVKHLTTFYLYVALGGALGGVFVNLIAPLAFSGYWEMHIGLVSVVVLAGICITREQELLTTKARALSFYGAWALATLSVAGAMVFQVFDSRDTSIYVNRTFYGVLYVDEWNTSDPQNYGRGLYHGSIRHGVQYMSPSFENMATSYYGINTGVGLALRKHPSRTINDPKKRGLNIGAVGLGVGTISTHAKPGDNIRYYEINPDVEFVANKYFTYLANSKAETDIVLGDARITLQQELDETGSNEFDVLILDAFSGDSIPMHLLTQEAFTLFDQHLKEDGILAIHITNQYLDLKPVMIASASQLGMKFFWIEGDGKRWYENGNDWIVLTRNQRFADNRELQREKSSWKNPTVITWNDDFNNMFEVIDWDD